MVYQTRQGNDARRPPPMVSALVAVVLSAGAVVTAADGLLPWQRTEQVPVAGSLKPLEGYLAEKLVFGLGGFELCSTEAKVLPLAEGQAGLALWVGARGDQSDRIVLLDDLALPLPLLLKIETGGMLEISILGYLGIKEMAAAGKPLAWPVSR